MARRPRWGRAGSTRPNAVRGGWPRTAFEFGNSIIAADSHRLSRIIFFPSRAPEIEEPSASRLSSFLAIRLLFAYTFDSFWRAKYFLWGRVFQSPRVASTGDVRVMFVSVCRILFERESWPPPITPSAHFPRT